MIFDKYLHLNSKYSVSVEVYSRNNKSLGKGTLNLNQGKVPLLEIDNNNSSEKDLSKKQLFCKSSFITYTLIDCEFAGEGRVYPRVVIKGESTSARIKRFSVMLRGLSEWFDNTPHAENEGNSIKKDFSDEEFSVEVTTDNLGKLRFTKENSWEASHPERNIFQVTQYSLITVEKIDRSFNIDQAIEKAYEVRNLFSLLLGYPLDIDFVIDKTNKNPRSVYFANKHRGDKPFEHKQHCLLSSAKIYKSEKWDNLFVGAFEKNHGNFKHIWSRLPNTMESNGSWESDFFSTLSLLDAYTHSYARNHAKKLPRSKYKAIRQDLESVISQHRAMHDENEGLQNQFLDLFTSLEGQIKNIKNSSHTFFQQNLNCAIEHSNSFLIKALGLTQDDFKHLKNLRNNIAHGNPVETKDHYNITHESILIDKISVLLLYWAYRDLGLDDQEIAYSLENFLHPIVRNAHLCKNALEEVSQRHLSLHVNLNDFKKIKDKPHSVVILKYLPNRKNYSYLLEDSELITQRWWSPEKSQKRRSLEEFIKDYIDASDALSVTYIGTVYLRNGNQAFHSSSVCLINCPRKTVNKYYHRRLERDLGSNQWSQVKTT